MLPGKKDSLHFPRIPNETYLTFKLDEKSLTFLKHIVSCIDQVLMPKLAAVEFFDFLQPNFLACSAYTYFAKIKDVESELYEKVIEEIKQKRHQEEKRNMMPSS